MRKNEFRQYRTTSYQGHIAPRGNTNCGIEKAEQPPYSPDLAPSDYYLFPPTKQALHGKSFDEDETIETFLRAG